MGMVYIRGFNTAHHLFRSNWPNGSVSVLVELLSPWSMFGVQETFNTSQRHCRCSRQTPIEAGCGISLNQTHPTPASHNPQHNLERRHEIQDVFLPSHAIRSDSSRKLPRQSPNSGTCRSGSERVKHRTIGAVRSIWIFNANGTTSSGTGLLSTGRMMSMNLRDLSTNKSRTNGIDMWCGDWIERIVGKRWGRFAV